MNEDNTNSTSDGENQEKIPEVEAFQDEFTKQFLQSTTPSREGYYPFLSGNGQFKMDFPEDMVILEEMYTKDPKDRGESFIMYNPSEKQDIHASYSISYYGFSNKKENSKEQISDRVGTDLDFYEVPLESDSQSLYVAEFDLESGTYGVAGLIWNNGYNEAQIISDVECSADADTCSSIKEKEKERIINWMKSMQLIDSRNDSE